MPHDDAADASEKLTDLAHLASAVGHHVINGYAAVVSNAEILRVTSKAEVRADPVAVADLIIRTAVEAAGVARRLIDYTHPITALGGGSVALDELIAEVVEARRRDGPARCSWAAEPSPVPGIRGHADRLKAMVGHLVRNAEEAMGAAGGTITLSTEVDNRGWIALEVADTGSGMTPDVHERALEPFFTTRSGHMGVGLSIANGIWRRHRGTLALRTRPGEGTIVRLCVDPNDAGPPGLR